MTMISEIKLCIKKLHNTMNNAKIMKSGDLSPASSRVSDHGSIKASPPKSEEESEAEGAANRKLCSSSSCRTQDKGKRN